MSSSKARKGKGRKRAPRCKTCGAAIRVPEAGKRARQQDDHEVAEIGLPHREPFGCITSGCLRQ